MDIGRIELPPQNQEQPTVNIRQVLLIGVVLGVVAALVVWYLERFETNKLHDDMRRYMTSYDRFRDWMREQEQGEA